MLRLRERKGVVGLVVRLVDGRRIQAQRATDSEKDVRCPTLRLQSSRVPSRFQIPLLNICNDHPTLPLGPIHPQLTAG